METKQTRLETFFIALERMIASGTIKRGKDFKLAEEANGKVLYLHIESIYIHYHAIAGGYMDIASLRTYLECSREFVKYKPICFEWNEPMSDKVNRKHAINVCAVMLCYDTLKEEYNIDFEKYSIEDFETALLEKHVDIDELVLKGRYVNKAIGYIFGQKNIWKADGSCYTKSGTPNPKYNLKLN